MTLLVIVLHFARLCWNSRTSIQCTFHLFSTADPTPLDVNPSCADSKHASLIEQGRFDETSVDDMAVPSGASLQPKVDQYLCTAVDIVLPPPGLLDSNQGHAVQAVTLTPCEPSASTAVRDVLTNPCGRRDSTMSSSSSSSSEYQSSTAGKYRDKTAASKALCMSSRREVGDDGEVHDYDNVNTASTEVSSATIRGPHNNYDVTAQAADDAPMTDLTLNDCQCGEWLYEALLVEVKGPGDHLSQTQIMWLQILNAASYSGTREGGCEGFVKSRDEGYHMGGLRALVVHVREEKQDKEKII